MPITDNTPAPPPSKAKTVRTAAESKTTAARTEALTGLGQLAQVPLMATRQFADAGAVGLHWPQIAAETAKLAESLPQVARLIDPLIKAGPYAGIVTAVLPLIMQVGVNHGRVPAGTMGTVPGDALAAQIEARLAEVELEALRSQQQAEASARDIRERIAEARGNALNLDTDNG